MTKIFVVLSLLFISISLFAETLGTGSKSSGHVGSGKLPHCISDASKIEAIKAKIKANSKNEFKYDAYKKALVSDSDEELMARLVYAETKAANCQELNDKVAPIIATVIANRVKIKKGDVKAVVFQRDQFASSLNIYSESAYKEFLCPTEEKLWKSALIESSYVLSDKAKPTDTVNYFLYKHSPRWIKEPWLLAEDQALTGGNVSNCIKAFKNPNYK